MAKGGKKYRLLLYEHILDRWWPMTLFLAVVIFGFVGVLWGAEWYYVNPADNVLMLPKLSSEGGTVLLAVGILVLLFTFFLLIARKMAYVQLFNDHMRLSTPFMRVNISYKRIQRTTTSQVSSLFPPKSLSGSKRDVILPIAGNQVVVIHLTSYPLSRATLKLFFSPFFFYDQTPHFVLIIDDWMGFGAELESRRMGVRAVRKPVAGRGTFGLLDDLKKK